MTKRILSMALALCVCLTMLVPAGVWANNTGGGIADEVKTVSNENSEKGISLFSTDVAEVTIGGTATQYADIDAAFTAAQEADSAAVKLLQNVTIQKDYSYGIELTKGDIMLDLNGCSLSTTDYESFIPLGAVFYMGGGDLTINDNSSDGSGKIVQPNAGPAVYVSGESTLIINSGTIENTYEEEPDKDDYKCAVFVNGGEVTVNGGTIGTGGSAGDGLSYVSGTAILKGGTFKRIEIIKNFRNENINANVTVSNLLGAGRSYRYANETSPDSYEVDVLENVSVVEGKIPIQYQRYDKSSVFNSASVDTYTDVTAETKNWTEDVYVVTGNVNITGDVTVTGKPALILRDGASLTINGCLSLAPDTETTASKGLIIYGQSGQTGTMSIINEHGSALNFSDANGNVGFCVYGGSFSATGSPYAISNNDVGSSVVINVATGWKSVADGSAVTDGNFEDKQSFTVEKCTTPHEWRYYYNDEMSVNAHRMTCRLCNFDGGEAAHSASRYENKDNSEHTEYCVCGKEIGTAAHVTEVVVNDDGLTHKTACKRCGYAAAEETHNFVNGVCTACGAKLAAEYSSRKYTSLQKAIDDATKAENGTVTLAADKIAENVTVTGGNIIIDLNGKEWMADISNDSLCIPLLVDGGSVTLKNGKIYQKQSGTTAQSAIVVNSGSITVEGDVSVMGGMRDPNFVHSSVDLQGGNLTLKQGVALLTGLQVPENSKLADYLPAGTAFVKCTYEYTGDKITVSSEYVSGVYTTNKTSEGMAIVEHRHSYTTGKNICDCGYTCTHETFANGLCTACGYACPHMSMNANGRCSKCHVVLTASVTDSNGNTSYYADGYYPNSSNTRSGLDCAFEAAVSGSTVTVLGGSSIVGYLDGDKALILNLNGKSVRTIYVGQEETSNSLSLMGNGSIGSVLVYKNNTADLTGWSGEMDQLYVYNGGKVTLNGGTFNKVVLSGNTAGSLLASGYAFRKNDGTFVEYIAKQGEIENVTVVQCTHGEPVNGKCPYCNSDGTICIFDDTQIAGMYTDLSTALGELENGQTLKLYKDFVLTENAEIAKNATLDLNGNNIDLGEKTFDVTNKVSIVDTNSEKTGSITGTVSVKSGGRITIPEGSILKIGTLDVAEGGAASLAGGKFGTISVASGSVRDLLEEEMHYWYQYADGTERIQLYDATSIGGSGNSVIAVHACGHRWWGDTCNDCGKACLHGNFETDKETGLYKCPNCKQEMVAVLNGTYHASLLDAMDAAGELTDKPVITMLANSFVPGVSGVSIAPDGEYSIDTKGKTISSSPTFVTSGLSRLFGGGEINSETVSVNGTLTIEDVKITNTIEVGDKYNTGTLYITGGEINAMTVTNGKVSISGGTFAKSFTLAEGISFADLLAEGYAYAKGGELLKLSEMQTATNFTVARCTNSTELDNDGKCPYCGLQFVAEACGTKYTTITAALNADSNVKLIADVNINEQLIINAGNAVIDLNGKTINCNVVGNAILVNGGMLTIRDSSEGKSGEICDKCNETSAAVCVSGGKLIIESGNYTISGDYSTAVKQTGGSLEIKGGNFAVSGGEKSYAVLIDGGTEFKLSGTPELTAHHNNEQRCLVIASTYNGTASLSGGNFGYIKLENNMTLKDILAVGYGFKTGENTWVSDGKYIAGATVKQLPIQSLSYDDSISINYGEKAILTVMPEKAKDAGEVTYQWYSGASPITGANNSILEIAGLTVNETGYTYYVEATCDGYTYRSEDITVTVNKVASTYEEAPAPKANLSYTGEAQELITAGSTKDGDIEYRVNDQATGSTDIPMATNAGTYTIYYRIAGDENHNDSEEQSIEVTIAPMKLYGAAMPEIAEVTKTFDGTDETNLSSVKFYKENRNDKIEIAPSAYEITDVHFNDANAGNDKSLFFTVTLKSNNYILLTRSGELVRKETYECGRSGGYIIAKAAAPTLENTDTSLKYADTTEQTASVTGKMPANAGTLIYAKGTEDLINYVDKWSVEEDGTVTYTISGANAGTVITLPVKISSTNYNDTTVNVIITITKATPTGEPAYDRISEKDKTLADTNLSDKDKDGKNKFSVTGTVKWADDDTTEVKQGEKYKWIFTPADTVNYNTLTGEITLWPYPAGGGGIAPADEDVITVDDKISSETTTKTTVKDTKTETVKNEQGEEISKVTASVSEKVAEKLVDQAVSNKSDTVEITVKSNDGNKVDGEKQTEIEIPKSAVESIAKDTDADLVIKTDNGQVILDNKTLETIAAEAEGDTVRIVVNENTQLKEAQKPALDVIGKNGKLFDIKAIIGDRIIHDFKGGKAHVTLPMPEKLKGKDIVVIYINDKGICEILNHTMETVGADEYIKFTTSHFSNFAVVEKADAEKIIEQQNADKINSLIKEAKLKATTSKTSKKNVKIKVSVKNNNSLIKEAKAMGYTVKYKFYRSTKKASKYKAVKTKTSNSYINTKGKKGTKYYYKAKVMVYDGKKLVAQTALKQCSYGARRWSK